MPQHQPSVACNAISPPPSRRPIATSSGGQNQFSYILPFAPTADAWHVLTMVLPAGDATWDFYIDGVKVNTLLLDPTYLPLSTTHNLMGQSAWPNDGTARLVGDVRQVSVWPKRLTSAELADVHSQLVERWSFCALGQYRNSSGSCEPCQNGTYANTLSATSCSACPAGTTTTDVKYACRGSQPLLPGSHSCAFS